MSNNIKVPNWILQCLDQYENCACGYEIVKKYGKDKLLDFLESKGYPCELEIISDQKDKTQYPKEGTYILQMKSPDLEELDDDDEDE